MSSPPTIGAVLASIDADGADEDLHGVSAAKPAPAAPAPAVVETDLDTALTVGDAWIPASVPGKTDAADGSALRKGSSDSSDSSSSSSSDDKKKRRVSYLHLLRFSTAGERVWLVVGVLACIVHGASWPAWSVLFGRAITELSADDESDVRDKLIGLAIYFCIVGGVVGLATMAHNMIFGVLSARQASRMRAAFVSSVLRQEMTWHDENPSAALDVRIAEGIPKIQSAISAEAGQFTYFISQGFLGVGVAIFYSWQLGLVIVGFLPAILGSIALFTVALSSYDSKTREIYEGAGIVADETLTLIRTVMSLGTFELELSRYVDRIAEARAAGRKFGRYIGLGLGLPDTMIFALYGVALIVGGGLVRSDDINPGDILTVLFAGLLGGIGVGQALGIMPRLIAGMVAAYDIFAVIDRQPVIDALGAEGADPQTVQGRIEFRGVHFAYPSKPDTPVLRGMDFVVAPGQSLALVGASGCGKSTVISLLERFYDPRQGSILLDGVPIQQLKPEALHKHIGLVTQTPVLLDRTIYDNIAMGRPGATREEVEQAARNANAHNFITGFPEGYNTRVGDLGSQLSGGQRQRISIARVMLKNPKVLLLDEATSALDNQSEAVVQAAIDSASKGRTTITIAHRLSTVRHCTQIAVVEDGCIVELGSHEELEALGGRYHAMLQRQTGQPSQPNQRRTSAPEFQMADALPSALTGASPRRSSAPGGSPEKTTSANGAGKLGALAEDGEDGEDGKSIASSSSSSSSSKKDDELDEIDAAALDESALHWAWSLARTQRVPTLLSLLGGLLVGVQWPLQSIVLSEGITEMTTNANKHTILWYAIAFFGLAVLNIVGHMLRAGMAFRVGETLTFETRKRLLAAIIHQPSAWFDDERHSKSRLAQRLAVDAAKVREIVADFWSVLTMASATLVGGLVIALIYCWTEALVVLGAVPFLAFAGIIIQMQGTAGNEHEKERVFANATKLGKELMESVRIVTSLGHTRIFIAEYTDALAPGEAQTKSASVKYGLATFLGEFSNFGAFALAFFFAGVVVDEGWCNFDDVFTSLLSILFCGMVSGFYAGTLPKFGEAAQAVRRVMVILKSCEEAQEENKNLDKPEICGEIEFQNVDFTYPTRPDQQILHQLSFRVPAGSTVAFVGESGSGKSTILDLVQKMYHCNGGRVLVDGVDVEDIDTHHLRQAMGVVEQEPKLFNTTIKESIVYGQPGDVDPSRVLEAACIANVEEFARNMPDGYDSPVGKLGEKLSGGQRQRVAIARAVMRKEQLRIMVLDEATSALDVHSEKLVQDALNHVCRGRTTLIVAHRLSSIQAADCIFVLDKGRIVEQGTHDELMAAKGAYFKLYTKSEHADDDAADEN